jgi:hypothetical protein
MTRKAIVVLASAGLLLFCYAIEVHAQVVSATYLKRDKKISILFAEDVLAVKRDKTLLFFEDDTGKLVQLQCDANASSNAITLDNFRTDLGSVDLVTGVEGIAPIPPGKSRIYNIVLKDVLLNGASKPKAFQTSTEINSSTGNPPQIVIGAIDQKANIPYNRREIIVAPNGIAAKTLLDRFKGNPSQIKISYKFDKSDPSPDVDTTAAGVRGDPDETRPSALIITPRVALPLRAKNYTVKVSFPADGLVTTDSGAFQVPADAKYVEGSRVAELSPSTQTERAKTQFYVETTYTSTVAAKDRKRANVGIFGIHWKPTLPFLTRNVFGENGNAPVWMAFRPLLEADFDTQSVKVSKSPNRIQFGMDYELGRDAGLRKVGESRNFLQQIVWINGVRYDSDRDFKLQTIYWHTELVPRFLNFEQTTEGRQFAFDLAHAGEKSSSKGPFVSAYRIKPSIGYELGGIVKRDARTTTVPVDRISRPLVGLDLSIELKRILSFGTTGTYYFLENAPRRRHRGYSESSVQLNTGFLMNRNFNGLQNAIILKFQRGDQPPTFGPVNALSLGFKIFQ